MSIQEQRRKAFEFHATVRGWPITQDNCGDYVHQLVREAWDLWNDAIDSIEIELPPHIPAVTEWNKGYNTGLARASEAISACLKVKL